MDKLAFPEIFKCNYDVQKCRFTPVVTFHYNELEKLLMGNLKEFQNGLEELHKYINEYTGFGWGNKNFRMSNIYGDEFTFSILRKEFNLWDITGCTHIFRCVFPDDLKQRKQVFYQAVKASENYTQGIIQCSGCHKDTNLKEARKRRYFAGIYCEECWEGKWKAIEAKENYN
jgi:hypothetical protein